MWPALLALLATAAAVEPPPQQLPPAPQRQGAVLGHQQALVKLIALGQSVSGGGGGGLGAAAVAQVLRDPQQRGSIMQLLQSLMQPGAVQAVVRDAEQLVGPMPPNVLQDAQKMEAAASKIRQSWALLAPSATAPRL